jgi:hypothetical protein
MKLELPREILTATAPIDLGLSFDRLAGIVSVRLGREPRRGREGAVHSTGNHHAKKRSKPQLTESSAKSSMATRLSHPPMLTKLTSSRSGSRSMWNRALSLCRKGTGALWGLTTPPTPDRVSSHAAPQ